MKHARVIHRRGVVMLVALLFLAILGMAMLSLSELGSSEIRRTGEQRMRAQLDQMLTAGMVDALAQFDSARPPAAGEWGVELPPELASRGDLRAAPASPLSGDRATLVITARLERRIARQTIDLRRQPDGWHLAAARLELD